MYEHQIFQGNWEDVSLLHGNELQGRLVEVRVLAPKDSIQPKQQIRRGMFPELLLVTDHDFELAEWNASTTFEL